MMLTLMAILLTSPWRFAQAQSCSPQAQYSQSNFKLKDHEVKKVSMATNDLCLDECALHQNCHSINFHQDKGICKLNDANHLSNPESLVYSYGSSYFNYFPRPVAKCSNKLCSEPLTCEMLDDGVDYKCVGFEVLQFPRKNIVDKVVLENPFVSSLTAFTVALWAQPDPSTTSHGLFSYATLTTSSPNEITLYSTSTKTQFSVGSAVAGYAPPILDGKWHHLCFTWANAQGKYKIYIDGVKAREGVSKAGHVIGKGAVVLGQDQDSYKGGFKQYQSLQGNLTSVNMWDKVLTAQEVSALAKSCREGEGNLVKWSDLKDKGEENVKLIRSTVCN